MLMTCKCGGKASSVTQQLPYQQIQMEGLCHAFDSQIKVQQASSDARLCAP